MLERLEPVLVDANMVVDLGAGGASSRRRLKRRFRGAKVVSLDIASDTGAIPLDDGVADVVFANLLLPRCGDPAALFSEVARVLRQDGLFAFSAFGPDTLPELGFPDMHIVGDAALRAGLRDPVLDVDRTILGYDKLSVLHRDLADLGLSDSPAAGEKPLELELELELVYGHCWGAGPAARDGSVRIDPAQITRR